MSKEIFETALIDLVNCLKPIYQNHQYTRKDSFIIQKNSLYVNFENILGGKIFKYWLGKHFYISPEVVQQFPYKNDLLISNPRDIFITATMMLDNRFYITYYNSLFYTLAQFALEQYQKIDNIKEATIIDSFYSILVRRYKKVLADYLFLVDIAREMELDIDNITLQSHVEISFEACQTVLAQKVLSQLRRNATESIPAACGGAAETKAAYRFFDNDQVTAEKVHNVHFEATSERMSRHSIVLIPQDTTVLNFSTKYERKDTGPTIREATKGMHVHCAIAVTPEKSFLGKSID